MSARDEAVEMIRRICPPHLSRDEYGRILADKFDAYRAEVLREAAAFVGNDDTCGCGGCDSCVPRALAAGLLDMADGRKEEATAEAATATPFFQPGRTYLVDGFEYQCKTVETHPVKGEREAWCWWHRGDDVWTHRRLYDADYARATPYTGGEGDQ